MAHAAVALPPGIQGTEDREIVRRFALGERIGDIAGENTYHRRAVSELISRACGHSRARAHEAVAAYDAAMARPAGRRAREAAATEAADPLEVQPIDLDALGGAENMPAEIPAAAAESAPIPEPLGTPVQPPTIDALLQQAETLGARPAEIAVRIRELVDELAGAVARAVEEAAIRARLVDVNRERDELLEQLRVLTGEVEDPRSPDGVPLSKAELAAIRDWAALNGRYCPPRARPGRQLIAEYRAAMAAASAVTEGER